MTDACATCGGVMDADGKVNGGEYCPPTMGGLHSAHRWNPCQWFALCDHPATKTREHPILGAVPICDRCDAKMAQLDALGDHGKPWRPGETILQQPPKGHPMMRFTIDTPKLHNWWAKGNDNDVIMPSADDSYGGRHMAEFLIDIIDKGCIAGPHERKCKVMGVDEIEDPAAIVIHLADADDDLAPGWGYSMVHELDDYWDTDDLEPDWPPLAAVERAVAGFVHQLNELDRWRLIRR